MNVTACSGHTQNENEKVSTGAREAASGVGSRHWGWEEREFLASCLWACDRERWAGGLVVGARLADELSAHYYLRRAGRAFLGP